MHVVCETSCREVCITCDDVTVRFVGVLATFVEFVFSNAFDIFYGTKEIWVFNVEGY